MAKRKPILATSPGPYLGGYPQKAAGWGEVATAATRPTTQADSSDSSGLLPGYPQNKGPFLGGYPQNKGPFLPGYPQEPLGFGDNWLQNYIANLGKQIGESIKNIKVKPGDQAPPPLPKATNANQVAPSSGAWPPGGGATGAGAGGGTGGDPPTPDLLALLMQSLNKNAPSYKAALALAQQLYAGTFKNIDTQTTLGQRNIAGLSQDFAKQLAGVPAQVGRVYDTSIAQQNALSQSLRDALQGSNPQQANTALLGAVGAPASQVAANQAQNQGLYGAGGNTLFAQGSIGTRQLINDRAVQEAWAAQQPGIAAGQAQIAAGQFAAQQAQQRNALSAQLPQLAYNIYGQQLQNRQSLASLAQSAVMNQSLLDYRGVQGKLAQERIDKIINQINNPTGGLTAGQAAGIEKNAETLAATLHDGTPQRVNSAGDPIPGTGKPGSQYAAALSRLRQTWLGQDDSWYQAKLNGVYMRGELNRPWLNPNEKQALRAAKLPDMSGMTYWIDQNDQFGKKGEKGFAPIGAITIAQRDALQKAGLLPSGATQKTPDGKWVYLIAQEF